MNNITGLLFLIFTSLVCLIPSSTNGCSMYKVTKDGQTIVGNNEDWISPNSLFWYEKGARGQNNVMYMGQLNRFTQGAINDKGLMFDGFANPYLAINNSEGKLEISISKAIRNAMQTMDNVEAVKTYFETLNLSDLESSMLVFVDATGSYLMIEGDELTLGEEPEQCFSNFYYSQIEKLSEVDLPNVQNGLKHMESTEAIPSMDYCASMMDHLSSVGDLTQYTTVYDLKKLIVQVYLYHDFDNFVTIDLKEVFKKGNHEVVIAELFPKDSKGYKNFALYNNESNPSQYIEDLMGDSDVSEKELAEMGMDWIVNTMGYEWLYDKENPKAAIDVFQYGVEIMPNDANLYDSLGEAYMINESYDQAVSAYNHSLKLNPENKNATEKLGEIYLIKAK